MNILVTANKTLGQIARAFHEKYPHLKLEFFGHGHQAGQLNPQSDRLPDELTIGRAGKLRRPEALIIHGNMKVRTLEQTFQDHFGIGVQVLRRSGNLWLQTCKTDEWTLSKQNKEGAPLAMS